MKLENTPPPSTTHTHTTIHYRHIIFYSVLVGITVICAGKNMIPGIFVSVNISVVNTLLLSLIFLTDPTNSAFPPFPHPFFHVTPFSFPPFSLSYSIFPTLPFPLSLFPPFHFPSVSFPCPVFPPLPSFLPYISYSTRSPSNFSFPYFPHFPFPCSVFPVSHSLLSAGIYAYFCSIVLAGII